MKENSKISRMIGELKKEEEIMKRKTPKYDHTRKHNEAQRLRDIAFKTRYKRKVRLSKTLVEHTCDDCGKKWFTKKHCPKCGLERI